MTSRRLWRTAGPPVLVIVVLAILVIWPTQRATGSAQERESAALTQTEDLTVLHAQLSNLTRQQDELTLKLETINSLVPAEQDLAGFLTELDTVADRTGIELRDVVPSQPAIVVEEGVAPPPAWETTVFSLRVEGDYQAMVNFAEALNHTERLVIIEHVTVGAGFGESLIGDFELQIFHQAGPAELDPQSP